MRRPTASLPRARSGRRNDGRDTRGDAPAIEPPVSAFSARWIAFSLLRPGCACCARRGTSARGRIGRATAVRCRYRRRFCARHLFFIRQGTLFAQSFDVGRRELTGTAFPVAEHVAVDSNGLGPAVSVSAAGAIAYRPASADAERQMVWLTGLAQRFGESAARTLPRFSTPSSPPTADRSRSNGA